MLIYRLENQEIIDAIVDIQKRGVKVEIAISGPEKGKVFICDQCYKKLLKNYLKINKYIIN